MKTDVTSAQTIKEQIYKAFSSFFPLNYPIEMLHLKNLIHWTY